jgi:hypothetical protein
MTGDSTRRARIETAHGDSERARRLARALAPDNTAEMDTRAEGARVVTTIARPTTGGLHSTVDDYLVNLTAGAQLLPKDSRAEHADGSTDDSPDTPDTSTHSDATDTHSDTSDTPKTDDTDDTNT